MIGSGIFYQQSRKIVVEQDLDPLLILVDGAAVVEELQLGLVTGGELDVEPDVVAGRHRHLLQTSRRFGRRLEDVLLPGLDDVQVCAGLRSSGNVLNDAAEDARVVRARPQDCQSRFKVVGDDLDVVVCVDWEAVAEPFDRGHWVTGELNLELGFISFGDCDGFKRFLEVRRCHLLLLRNKKGNLKRIVLINFDVKYFPFD